MGRQHSQFLHVTSSQDHIIGFEGRDEAAAAYNPMTGNSVKGYTSYNPYTGQTNYGYSKQESGTVRVVTPVQ